MSFRTARARTGAGTESGDAPQEFCTTSKSIFSTYHKSENRVTSTILAVLERLSNPTLLAFFQGIEENDVKTIIFENQYKKGNSVADARIFAAFEYIIETKIERNTVDCKQLQRHLRNSKHAKLIVLTPDDKCPRCIENMIKKHHSQKIIWCSFDDVYEILHTLKEQVTIIPSEVFLLSELQAFFAEEGLLNAGISAEHEKYALIVPARLAWPFYNKYGIYRCQEDRYFTPTKYMGFYADQKIQQIFPEIIGYVDSLRLCDDKALAEAEVKSCMGTRKESIARLQEFKKDYPNEDNLNNIPCKYVVLAKKDDAKRVVSISAPIINDKKTSDGKNFGFVLKQVYVAIDELKVKAKTSELSLYQIQQ